MEDVTTLMDTARRVATDAGVLLKRLLTTPRQVTHKGQIDLVTDADMASEALITAALQAAHPAHALLAEEGGARGPADAPITWVADPLDGTTNYAHGFPHFCVALAAVDAHGTVQAGCVADPMRGETFVAGHGQGAWLHEAGGGARRLHVSTVDTLARSLLATGFPYDRAHHADSNHLEHDALSMASQGVRRPGAAALDLAWVAAGRLDGYWEAHLKPWDVAAGALLVREAGGVLSGFDGAPFHWRAHHVVAAGPALHGALLTRLREVRQAAGFKPVPR